MHFLPILYSSCWIVSQSHASLHIVREEKQIFTITAGKEEGKKKKKKTWNIFKANMNKNWMQLKWKSKFSREAQMAQSSMDRLGASPAWDITEKQICSVCWLSSFHSGQMVFLLYQYQLITPLRSMPLQLITHYNKTGSNPAVACEMGGW